MIASRLGDARGNTLVGALIVLIVLGATAASVVNISGADIAGASDNMEAVQAMGVGNAGLQFALDKLNYGLKPDVANKPFARGTFTIVSDPIASLITVVATVGKALKTQSINADFAKNCVDLIVSQSVINLDTLKNIKLIKTCNKEAVLTNMTISWNWSDCAVGVNCDGSVNVDDEENNIEDEIVYEAVGDPPLGMFWICHVPNGADGNPQTIAMSLGGWISSHNSGTGVHYMDYLGPCIIQNDDGGNGSGGDGDDTVVTCTGTNQSDDAVDECVDTSGSVTLNQIDLAGTTIFLDGSIPDVTAIATSSGSDTDIEDTILTDNGEYIIDLQFSNTIPVGAWFTITTDFADGSSLTGIVKAGEEPAPEDNSDNANDDNPPNTVDGYSVENGTVFIDPNYEAKLDVLGSAITCGDGGPEVNVRVERCIDNSCDQLWGYTDVDGGETDSIVTSNIPYSELIVRANAYLTDCNSFSVTHDSKNTLQVKALTNGQQAPPLAGFGGQEPVHSFLDGYLDGNGNVVLADNQVIMLFELGIDLSLNPADINADFQDLVILLTITQL